MVAVNAINQEDTLSSSATSSILLELAALDDLDGFKVAVEQTGLPIDEPGLWYTRRIGSNTMSYELRTPLMVAALYGSINVLDYILRSGQSNINRVTGSDRVSALHCAMAGGSNPAVLDRLITASANADLISSFPNSKNLTNELVNSEKKLFQSQQVLPDINNGVYGTDEFRMYSFKIVPCSRAYTHEWTECPFAHPGENAKRRDPKKYSYTCVPCPEFKKGTCKKGDDCEFAHGIFESWLHPAQYRTRICKDETGCSRKVCFFAHNKEELRPVCPSTGSAIPISDMTTPKGNFSSPRSPRAASLGVSPPSLQLPGSRLRASLSAREMVIERELMKMEQQFLLHQQQQILSPLSPANLGTINIARKLSPPRNGDSSSPINRSQSFFDRIRGGTGGYGGACLETAMSPVNSSNWGSPNGKLDWGIKGEELQKLRKSNSFGVRSKTSFPTWLNEPNVSWVNSLVKDEARPSRSGGGVHVQGTRSPWVEQSYMEPNQLVA